MKTKDKTELVWVVDCTFRYLDLYRHDLFAPDGILHGYADIFTDWRTLDVYSLWEKLLHGDKLAVVSEMQKVWGSSVIR